MSEQAQLIPEDDKKGKDIGEGGYFASKQLKGGIFEAKAKNETSHE